MANQSAEHYNPYRNAQFLLSVNRWNQLPDENSIEIAFAGRSNAGKSSAINTITDNKALCRTSKTPGRTQMINYFSIVPGRHLVDLPGYGYAKVPEKIKLHWQKLLERYLTERNALKGVVIIMDVRHPLTEYDRQMLSWCQRSHMPAHILLTKADKFKRGAGQNILLKVRKSLKAEYPGTTAQLFSALNKTGVEEAQEKLNAWFDLNSVKAEE
jgi:GTP-binding protein